MFTWERRVGEDLLMDTWVLITCRQESWAVLGLIPNSLGWLSRAFSQDSDWEPAWSHTRM